MTKIFQNKVFLFAAAVIMIGGFLVTTPSVFAATVASQVDYYTVNNGTNFIRSLAPQTQSLSTSGDTVSQTINSNDSVTIHASSAIGYADSGFYTKTMKLKDVKSVTITGSGSFGVNIWLDTNGDNDFFTWNNKGNVYLNFGGDQQLSEGPVSVNGTLLINDTSIFHSYSGAYNPSQTLAELKALYPDKDITFWVGTTILEGGTQSATITAFDVEKSGTLSAQDFGVWNQSNVIGYSAGFKLTDATFTGATSIVVQLYSGSTLLQTDTATNPAEFPGLIQISSPFNVMGTFNYVSDNYWTNVRGTEYGQTMVPTKVVATVTLANGKVVTAENTNPPTGDLTIISNAGTLAAGVFGVMDFSNVKGYSAEFNLTDATLANATSIVVKLYSGDTVLQTNTSTGQLGVDYSAATLFSSPFDVLGSFNYPADTYWTNVRGSEYGKNLVPTKVVATVILANGKEVTAENTNTPTGDTTTIVPLGSLTTQDFGVWNSGGVNGYSAGFNLTDATFTGATSIVVKLYAADNQLLQTDTATNPTTEFSGLTQISSPFDIMGTFNYVSDNYWTNVRATEYGQTLAPTKVVATVTLANGKIVEATNTNPTGEYATIDANAGTLAAQDFGVWNSGGVKGYSAGFKLTDANFTGATVVVKLYSGDTLLQTNTATTTGFAGLTEISSPFDVLGSFNYPADGYWTNVRATEYGQTLVPTRVEATVILANGKEVTAENTNLTGDLTILFPTPASPATVDLLSADNYAILAKTAVTTTSETTVTGNIGISPAFASDTTGFSPVLDSTGCFSASSLVSGKIYAADYNTNGCATPAILTTGVSAMEHAYTDAAGRPHGVGPNLNIGGGIVATQTLAPGVYTWGSNVTITGDITLSGSETDVWIFQISGTLGIENGKKIILSGALPQNIFWQVAGAVTLKPSSEFVGNILAQTNIAMQTGATLNGRALAQTAVTLDANTITAPTSESSALFILTYTAGANGTITGTTSQAVGSDLNGTAVTAVANSGYHFVNWSDNSSTIATRTDTNVTVNITTTANFVADAITPPPSHGGGGGSVIRAVPAVPANVTTPDGCAPGDKFSTTTGRNCNAATPALPSVKPQVLGEKVYAGVTLTQLEQILADAGVVWSENIDTILANASTTRSEGAEKTTSDKYLAGLVHNEKNFLPADANRLNWFITYGTVGTKILGAGERAGVINSYLAAFGKLPKTEAEWQDAIKIANGRWPSARSEAALTKAKITFKAIYGREADMTNAKDNAAVTVMAYGLRPSLRNLNSEKAAILAFKYFIKRAPVSAIDWDTVRAIAYSGAKR